MPTIDFKRGFACGLVATGVSFGKGGDFPDGSMLNIVNCDYYRGRTGHCVAYLNPDTFATVFSSNVSYAPASGIVIISSFELTDWEDWGNEREEAILKIIVDDKIFYEGDIYTYFEIDDTYLLKRSKAFSYKNSFSISAKRTNKTNGMALELYKTCIISTV